MRKFYTESMGALEVKSFDKEKKEIYDVVILGKESKNNRVFSDKAMEQAAKMLEGATSFLNHRQEIAPGKHISGHNAKNILGFFEGVQFDGQKVRAKVFKVTNSEHVNFVFDMVENHKKGIGFSIDWAGSVSQEKDNKKTVVESFDVIRSADLVAGPATTNGFFESEREDEVEKKVTLDNFESEYPDIYKGIVEKIKKELGTENEKLIRENKRILLKIKCKEQGVEEAPEWALEAMLSAKDDAAVENIITTLAGKDKKKVSNPPKKDAKKDSSLESDAKNWLITSVVG